MLLLSNCCCGGAGLTDGGVEYTGNDADTASMSELVACCTESMICTSINYAVVHITDSERQTGWLDDRDHEFPGSMPISDGLGET